MPFRALLEDFKRSCTYNHVNYEEWNTNNKFPASPIVLVALEHLSDVDFQAFATCMCTLGCLARIVIEKGHIALTSQHFRNTSTLTNLFMLCTQVILISATVPPTAMTTLERLLGLKCSF